MTKADVEAILEDAEDAIKDNSDRVYVLPEDLRDLARLALGNLKMQAFIVGRMTSGADILAALTGKGDLGDE